MPEWTKGADCKSAIRGFESHSGLWFLPVYAYAPCGILADTLACIGQVLTAIPIIYNVDEQPCYAPGQAKLLYGSVKRSARLVKPVPRPATRGLPV